MPLSSFLLFHCALVVVVVVVDVDGVDHGEDSVGHGEDKRQESKSGKLSVAAWK